MTAPVGAALTTLGYDAQWLEYGFLDEANLLFQSERYSVSDDKNTEHYRYGSFRLVLHSHPTLHDDELNHYIELAQADPDRMMADAALADLAGWPRLTPPQSDALSRHPAFQTRSLQKIIHRRRLLAELAAVALTDDLFTRCLTCRDFIVHSALLERPDLTAPQVTTIAEQGCRRAVRKRAGLRVYRMARMAERR